MRKTIVFLTALILAAGGNFPAPAQNFGRGPLRPCWMFHTDNAGNIPIASDNNGKIFSSSDDGSVTAIDSFTGQKMWRTDLGGEIAAPLLYDASALFVLTGDAPDAGEAGGVGGGGKAPGHQVYSINSISSASGVSYWQKKIPAENISADTKIYLLNDFSNLYLLTSAGQLFVLDKQSGNLLFRDMQNVQVTSPPLLVNKTLYFGAAGDKFLQLSFETPGAASRMASQMDAGITPTTIYLSDQNIVYIGDGIGNVSAFHLGRKKILWKTRTGAAIADITAVGQNLLVSSFDNYVYLLAQKNGSRLWKKRLAGRSIGTPPIRDNVALISPIGGDEAVLIELKAGKTVNQVSVAADDYLINNSVLSGDYIVLQTVKGLTGISAGHCVGKK